MPAEALAISTNTPVELGIPLAPDKVEGPTTCLSFPWDRVGGHRYDGHEATNENSPSHIGAGQDPADRTNNLSKPKLKISQNDQVFTRDGLFIGVKTHIYYNYYLMVIFNLKSSILKL